jgi:peptidoglycan/xylan/chitin deacetylase (PgdA/CDA1 family)
MTAKTAYLTIDDAPSPSMRAKVDFLLARAIPAVWFCNGDALELRPEAALYAIQKGFMLGNHAYQHRRFSELSLEEGFFQIRRADEILEGLYARAGVPRPAKFFRFPYLDKGGTPGLDLLKPDHGQGLARRQAFQAYLAQLGYSQPAFPLVTYAWFRDAGLGDELDWCMTYDTKDWALNHLDPVPGFENIDKVMARMEENVPEDGRGLNSPGSAEIVLMHDQERTEAYFYRILTRLLEKGLRFHPLSQP